MPGGDDDPDLAGRHVALRAAHVRAPRSSSGLLVGEAFFLTHDRNPLPGAVLLRTGQGAAVQRVQKAIQHELASCPAVQVQTRSQFEKSRLSSVSRLLGLVCVLLALAVHIAVIGIVNALMFSVFERAGEIGLLRAVGMKRRQVRAMAGIIIGTGLGAALVSSLKRRHRRAGLRLGGIRRPVRAARSGGCYLASPEGGQAGRLGRRCWPLGTRQTASAMARASGRNRRAGQLHGPCGTLDARRTHLTCRRCSSDQGTGPPGRTLTAQLIYVTIWNVTIIEEDAP